MKKLIITISLVLIASMSVAKESNIQIERSDFLISKPSFNIDTAFIKSDKTPFQCYNYCTVVVGLPTCAPHFSDSCMNAIGECLISCLDD